MKVGMICECAPGGPDVKIGEHFVKEFIPGAEFVGVTMTNKANLIRDCGREVRRLLERERCDVVFIVWDLAPAWPDMKAERCRSRDKEGVRSSLKAAYGGGAQPADKLVLVCVEQMLESWVVADNNAVVEHVRRPTHKPPRFTAIKHPDREKDPKSRLISYFQQAGRAYNEHVDAVPILKQASHSMLRRSESFKRFAEKLSERALGTGPKRR